MDGISGVVNKSVCVIVVVDIVNGSFLVDFLKGKYGFSLICDVFKFVIVMVEK